MQTMRNKSVQKALLRKRFKAKRPDTFLQWALGALGCRRDVAVQELGPRAYRRVDPRGLPPDQLVAYFLHPDFDEDSSRGAAVLDLLEAGLRTRMKKGMPSP